jgi:hypothetical protein
MRRGRGPKCQLLCSHLELGFKLGLGLGLGGESGISGSSSSLGSDLDRVGTNYESGSLLGFCVLTSIRQRAATRRELDALDAGAGEHPLYLVVVLRVPYDHLLAHATERHPLPIRRDRWWMDARGNQR